MSKRRKYLLIILIMVLLTPVLWGIGWAVYLRIAEGYVWVEGTGLEGKSLWDWLELLIVPIVLASAALLFNWSQRRQELEIADAEREKDREIAKQRVETDRNIAKDRLQEANLQTYLDKMAELLLEKDLLHRSHYLLEPVRDVGQTLTTTILRTLDKDRRDIVFQFLRDSGLADTLLVKAHLGGIDLHRTYFAGINLSGANLHEAVLYKANLRFANLSGAYLREADLSGAELFWANLGSADLGKANLSGAKLSETNLSGAILEHANLSGAGLLEVNLSGATLEHANLSRAVLLEVNLSGATLEHANLSGAALADLRGANLSGADLRGAIVTKDQLKDVISLERAIMPNGKVFDPEIHKC